MRVDVENGMITKSFYDEKSDKLVTQLTYDNSSVLSANIEAQKQAPETGRYKGNFVHVGEIHIGDIARLKASGFDLLSADPDDVRRALLHIQSNERNMLKVPGTPIAKKKTKWV